MQNNEPPSNVYPFTNVRFENMLKQGIEKEMGIDSMISVQMPADDNLSLAHNEGFLNDVVDQVISALSQSLENIIGEPSLSSQQVDAPLRCSYCGCTSEGVDADCVTYLGKNEGEALRLGEAFEIDEDKIITEHYIKANPILGDDIHLLEGWWCEPCANLNWAEIKIRNNRVHSIWTVIFSEELFARLNYVSSEILEVVAELTNKPVWSLGHDESLEMLRDELND